MADGLCVYWRFNEVQASKVLDASGLNNYGSLEAGGNVSTLPLPPNDPISDENEWGESLVTGHALSGNVSIGDISGIQTSSDFTVEAFFKRVMAVNMENVCNILSFSSTLKVSLIKDGFLTIECKGTTYNLNKKLPLNKWTHVSVVCEKLQISVLIDGVTAFSGVNAEALVSPISMQLGSSVCETTEVRLWSLARPTTVLREFMNIALPRVGPASRWKGLRIKSDGQGSLNPRKTFLTGLEGLGRSRRNGNGQEDVESVLEDNYPRSPMSPPVKPVVGESPSDHLYKYELDAIDLKIVPAKTPPELADLKPEALPVLSSDLDVALDELDSMLQAALNKQYKSIDKRQIAKIIKIIASYIKAKYRIGPFLMPLPPHSLLSRLRIACAYFCLASVVANVDNSWGSTILLRIPLLPEHVVEIALSCIQEAKNKNDSRTVFILSKLVVANMRAFLSESEFATTERNCATFTEIPPSTRILCPFCRTKFEDPLQEACYKGCHTKFSVCFLKGSCLPTDACIQCGICDSVMSNKRKVVQTNRTRNVPTNHVMELPTFCPMCSMVGSLQAIR